MSEQSLRTSRLLLRPWRDSDLPPLAEMSSDPRVMNHFPKLLNQDECKELIGRIRNHFQEHGFGLWAVEIVDEDPFIGFVGLVVPRFQAHFTPCVEVGWRLASPFWGRGYATEAAREALAFGFERAGLPEIVSMTVPHNRASRRVMEKLEMQYVANGEFDHPLLPEGHHLRRHVLYRLNKADWQQSQAHPG